jgi:hypothetical protein
MYLESEMMSPPPGLYLNKWNDESDIEETKEMYNSPAKDSQLPSAKSEVEKRKTEICRIWKSGKVCPFVSSNSRNFQND